MKQCKNCGADISDKATFCGDACRMSYKRNPNKTEANPNKQPEHSEPEQPKNQPEQPKANKPEHRKSDKFVPNWKAIGLESVAEAKAYIIWHLKKSGILDYSVIVIGNKMFGNYKERRKEIVGDVKAFRADISV